MKQIVLALLLAATPAVAQDTDTDGGSGDMERGFRLFLDGLSEQMEPALRDLKGLARDAAPVLRRLQDELGEVVDDLDTYQAPEILPNGDILIRRKEPLEGPLPDGVTPNEDGSLDL
ncbi:hypothetical protein [Jannaschia rubra]|uniref:hypothetical protein n=1 Tax=Jannaschia rubra TaxID=282197 RepID=UPI0024914B41|nr:hypothetical protein [Jannaschia rubra]